MLRQKLLPFPSNSCHRGTEDVQEDDIHREKPRLHVGKTETKGIGVFLYDLTTQKYEVFVEGALKTYMRADCAGEQHA